MDFAIIASAAVSAITPFLVKGGEEISKGIGKDLWELIKKPFQSDKDKAIIAELEKNPDDLKVQGKVEVKLSDLLEADEETAEHISALLPRAQEEAKRVTILIQDSKNVVAGDQKINVAGDFIIGDK